MIYNVDKGGIEHHTCIFETQDPYMLISYNKVHQGLLNNIDVFLRILCENKTDLQIKHKMTIDEYYVISINFGVFI